MLNQGVSKRYAEALFEIAKEQGQVALFHGELKLVVEAIEKAPEAKAYLDNFLIKPEEKKETLRMIFADKVSPMLLNFLLLLTDKRRESYIGAIFAAFSVLYDEAERIKNTELYTAIEVSDEEIKALAEKLSAATGYTIRIRPHVEPDLIGGVKLRVEDRIIDGTLKKQLERLGGQMKYA